jgi:hypothetical protein
MNMMLKLQQVNRGISVVPNVATDLTDKDTYLYQINVANKSAVPVTFTVKDKQATARNVVPSIALDGNTLAVIAWPEGIYLAGGMNWVASAADALEAEVVAAYVPGV